MSMTGPDEGRVSPADEHENSVQWFNLDNQKQNCEAVHDKLLYQVAFLLFLKQECWVSMTASVTVSRVVFSWD